MLNNNFFCRIMAVVFIYTYVSHAALIIPSDVLTDSLLSTQHPLASQINAFNRNQATNASDFTQTGLTRTDYLRVIESIVLAMKTYQNDSGQIIDPVREREFQYATPCYAHAVSALLGSGYSSDTALLSSGKKAMDASISHMVNDNVPDGHGDFFTVPLMLAYWNYKKVVDSGKLSSWRTGLGNIAPASVYNGSTPNWIGVNTSGEYLRFMEGLTTITYTDTRIPYQATRMGKDGLYQDTDSPETLSVANTDGNSFAYDNFARTFLGLIAVNGYTGNNYQELDRRLWKGAWTGLLYQSPFGEVPTGLRSSHHFWNEASAAINYELWAAQYNLAGKPVIAGAFKRAAMISLSCVRKWLRSDGSGYVTKARYPIASCWGYMAYSSHTQYNLLCASQLATAWQYCDTTIKETPAPCDIGGYVCQNLMGFKKVFANAGGTYVQFDIRGDHAHNPTGLLRVHLKTGNPQLGPSDGAVGKVISGAQYWPLYPVSDPDSLKNLSIGPSWLDSTNAWYPLAEMQQIPTVNILMETPKKSSFNVIYTLPASAKLYETITVEPKGVTVVDSMVGGSYNSFRVNYPMLTFDGEDSTAINISGNQLTLQLKEKGLQFTVIRPSGATLKRTNYQRNHRNGRCERIYADITGRVAEYYISAYPEYTTSIANKTLRREKNQIFTFSKLASLNFNLPNKTNCSYKMTIYTAMGRIVAEYSGTISNGKILMQKKLPNCNGFYRAVIKYNNTHLERFFAIMR